MKNIKKKENGENNLNFVKFVIRTLTNDSWNKHTKSKIHLENIEKKNASDRVTLAFPRLQVECNTFYTTKADYTYIILILSLNSLI